MEKELIDTVKELNNALTCLHDQSEVERAIRQIAADMNQQLADENPIFLCVPVGGLIFLGQLVTRLNFPLEIDYIHASRYRDQTVGGELQWRVMPKADLKDRVVVLVDDILDGGITLKEIKKYCEKQGAKKVYTAVLTDKVEARHKEGLQTADFSGLPVENEFLVGYGLDYKGYFRNLPGIYKINLK